MFNRSQQQVAAKSACAVNRTDRPHEKAAVDAAALIVQGADGGFKEPSAEAVDKKPQCQLAHIHAMKSIAYHNLILFP